MILSSRNSFEVGNDEYHFEIQPALYTWRPLQLLNEQYHRLEDRFHRTVKITRVTDSRSWTGASDIKTQYMNDLAAYLQRWLEDCFAHWDLNVIPEGFEIPQGTAPREPVRHHCPVFPIIVNRIPMSAETDDSQIVDMASEESFPASDPPEWIGVRVA
jgi:hypothetical protein